MADDIAQKITELAVLTDAAAADVLAIVDDPAGGAATKKIAASAINKNIAITAAENAATITPTDLRFEPGDTQRYPNGLADALLVADQATATIEKDIKFTADETFGNGSEIAFQGPSTAFGARGISVRAVAGAVITYTGTGTAVTIGAAAEITRNIYWDVPIIRSGQNWDDGTDTASEGLRLVRTDRSEIIVLIEGFNTGLHLRSDGGGTVHNDIRIIDLLDNRQGILLSRNAGAGWNNSNFFHGGIITYRSGTSTTAQANAIVTKHIEQRHVSDNGNLFLAVDMEDTVVGGARPAGSVYLEFNGTKNRFLHGRFEGGESEYTQLVKFGSSSADNVLDFGRVTEETTLIATQINDLGNSNRYFFINNRLIYNSDTGIICGSFQATGAPGSSKYTPEADFAANLVAGPNTTSSANKVFAALGGSSEIISGITGTGRHGLGKDPAVNFGHEQLKDPDAGFDTESVNRTTFHKNTTDATPLSVNVDTIIPPNGAGTWLTMKVVCFDDASGVGMARIRVAFIQRIGTGSLAINVQSNLFDAQDGGPFAAVFAVSGTQINLTLTGVAATNLRWSGTLEWQHASVDEAFPP